MSRIALVFGLLALIALPAAGTPFRGDQALFAISGRQLADGAVLYRDIWDITNPGIYAFYTIAGLLFGFTEEGIHFFEFVYWCAFVGTVCEFTRLEHGLPRWPLMPVFFVGALYYWPSCSDPSQLTKTEGLVAFPIFVAMAAASRERSRWILIAGFAGGVVLLFKFLFGLCLLAGWAFLALERGRRRGAVSALRFGGVLALGMVAVLAPVVAYFAAHGALAQAVQTLFVEPRAMLAEADPAGFERLAVTIRWDLELYSVVMALSLLGSVQTLRLKRDPFVVALALVIFVSLVVIAVQRWSWWTYHVLLMGVPLTVMAGYSWPNLWCRVERDTTRNERIALMVCLPLLFLPAIGHGANAYRRLLMATDRAAARDSAGHAYMEARAIARWLDSRSGSIFVCGDPLVYWFANRNPAVPISGWSLELYHAAKRSELAAQLRAARPAAIFVQTAPHGYDAIVRNRYAELQSLLDAEYIASERTPLGTWYSLRRP
ncbi:MAG: hypothetical protein JNK93_10875 [Planctomycetia bacterium]|nr:hypothetical protein [Planctomycetia bacterium]